LGETKNREKVGPVAEPQRPPKLPKNAVWLDDEREWELGGKSKSGKKHGTYKYFRPDGTLCNECQFSEGVPDGPFKRFHENGEVSQEGIYLKGKLHGTRVWFATDSQTSERMHEGISETIRKSEMDYDMDRVIAVRHFDAEGNRVLPDGTPYPDRPQSVPRNGTEYRGDLKRWVEPHLDERGARHEIWRAWTVTGEPAEESEYVHGARHGRSIQLIEDATYELGYFDEDLAVESWSLVLEGGKSLWSGDLGLRQDDESLMGSPVLEDVRHEAAHWQALAEDAFQARRMGEGLLALARAAAASRSIEALAKELQARCLPRPEEAARALAQAVAPSEGFRVAYAVNGLLRGAWPSRVLQAVAIWLDQEQYSRAALDFVNAAILLAPQDLELLFTRGLVLMSLGLEAHARQDANALAAAEPEQAEFLLHYLDALFPTFDFWPEKEKPSTTYDGLPEKPMRSAAEVKKLVQKYAQRVQVLREELLTRVKPEAHWLPPDMTGLLKGAKVSLEKSTFTEGEGEITVDERLDVDGWDVPSLMRAARAEWACLTWLCWAAGQTRLSMPSKLHPPADFGQAAGMARQRLWRARDLRVSGPREVDAPSFEWEGMPIEEVPQALAHIAEGQYEDLQALFLWLADKAVRSPWQEGLRES
jgi:hypothetical protein